jgi:DNA repair exonuclease SbcCD ATPase subunit
MDVWLLIREAEALPPAAIFAAGALSLALVYCVIVVAHRLLARHRAARTAAYAVRDPRRLRAEAERLREACDASAASLETGIARLKQRALARIREFERATGEAQDLRHALAEKSSIIAELERAKADLELAKEKHLLELRRQEEELRARADALTAAQQTISLMRGMLGRPGRAASRATR